MLFSMEMEKAKARQVSKTVSDAPVSDKEPARSSYKTRPAMRLSSEQPWKTLLSSSRPTPVMRTKPEVSMRYP